MKAIHLIAIVTLLLYYFIYNDIICKSDGNITSGKEKKKWSDLFFIVVGLAFVLRLICAVLYKGHETDINCFMGWSNMVFENGIPNFYSDTTFTDYPPGYMYVLYVIGAIRKALNLDFNASSYLMLIKLPAILCDIITGSIIYKIAKERFKDNIAVLLVSLYLFNPVIILDSAIWGQVDSVFTLTVVLMCYYVYKKRLPFAYFAFAAGILIKPQTLIFTPVLIFGIIDQVILKNFNIKNFIRELLFGISAILFMILLALPFGFGKVFEQYTDTLSSYPYATINAYNIWTMFGLNWSPQTGKFLMFTYSQWGTFFILLIVLIASFISFKMKKNSDSKYFILGAFIVIAMFTFSVRMHERYMFPALALLLIGFVLRPSKELFLVYALYSVLHFYNVAHVLFVYDVNNFNPKATIPIVIAFASVLMFGYLFYLLLSKYIRNTDEVKRSENEKLKVQQTTNKSFFGMKSKNGLATNSVIRQSSVVKITKIDILPMLIITIIYSAIALYDLGNNSAPQTSWDTSVTGDSVILDFGATKHVTKISYFLGNYENRKFSIQMSDNMNGPWKDVSDIEMTSVFAWGTKDTFGDCRYMKLISDSDKTSVRELVITDDAGGTITPVNLTDQNVSALFDEQELFPERSTFRDSTYFDEIYHARTAYEYLHGLYSYENTHPPLGKIFIALGMILFGVNPFGWRIMGTLFGIAMVPFLYMFAKKLVKKTWLASITSLLFAFDFMHFTQTRIATIDVFVTFFIILMYYFMYQYYELSFYDTPLKKTFIPLGISGVAMGFGMACKWTGVYAGVGLGILFFITLYNRYDEYKIALKNPKGSTSGIKHQHIIECFSANTRKTIIFCCIFFVAIPIVIYTLSYLPFSDGQQHGLIQRMLKNQVDMYNYHTHVDATHPFSSWWYEWPTMVRPIWYYSGQVSSTVSEGISAFGNPLVWWVGIPAFVYMLYLMIKEKDEKALFLSITYLVQYLPWTLVSRIIFIYHYFPSVPFVTLMIGYAMYKLVEKHPKLKRATFVYAALAILLFIMFYPVLSGEPINKEYVFRWLRWFDGWILVS